MIRTCMWTFLRRSLPVLGFAFVGVVNVPTAFAQGQNEESPEVIVTCSDPTRYASQLTYRSRELSDDDAGALRAAGLDLSYLDPKASAIWKPNGAPVVARNFPSEAGTVEFKNITTSRDLYRGVVKSGNDLLYVNVASNSAEVLLMYGMLKKLGYVVEDMRWYRNLSIHFPSAAEMKKFRADVTSQNNILVKPGHESENASDWLVNEELATNTLTLRDVILESADIQEIRYQWGEIDLDRIGTNRASRSLIALYAMANLVNIDARQRGLNLAKWEAVDKFNDGLRFRHPHAGRFGSTDPKLPKFFDCDDIRWITRRIAALTADDWKSITDTIPFEHKDLNHLLLQKMISRRDTLVERVDSVFNRKQAPNVREWAPIGVFKQYYHSRLTPFLVPANLDRSDEAVAARASSSLVPSIPFERNFTGTETASVVKNPEREARRANKANLKDDNATLANDDIDVATTAPVDASVSAPTPNPSPTPMEVREPKMKIVPVVRNGEVSAGIPNDPCCVLTLTVPEIEGLFTLRRIGRLSLNEVIGMALGEFTSFVNQKSVLPNPNDVRIRQAFENAASEDQRLVDYTKQHGSQDGFQREVAAWAVTWGNFVIQMNREITTGSFYGSKAGVQLVDTVVIGVGANAIGGVFGKAVLAPLVGSVAVTKTHVFTHVRPIKSIDDIKYFDRFAAMYQPRVFNHIRDLVGAANVAGTDSPGDAIVTDFLTKFTDTFQDGEVLTITKGLSGRVGVQHTFNAASIFGPMISRYVPGIFTPAVSHEEDSIHQVSFNRSAGTIQIFDAKMKPKTTNAGLTLGVLPSFMKTLFSVASVGYEKKGGSIETDALAIDLSSALPDPVDGLAGAKVVKTEAQKQKDVDSRWNLLRNLRIAFTHADADELKKENPFVKFHHLLQGHATTAAFLGLFRSGRYKDGHLVTFTFPQNENHPKSEAERTLTLFSQKIIHLNGRDPYGFVGNVANSIFGVSFIGPKGASPDPSATFFGQSHLQSVQVDADLTERESVNNAVAETQSADFLRVGYFNEAYRGTIKSGDGFRRILKHLSDQYAAISGTPIYTEADFENVKNIQNYDIRSRIVFFPAAMQKFEHVFSPDTSSSERREFLASVARDPIPAGEEDRFNWLDQADNLASRMHKTKAGQFIANLFDLFQRKATSYSERDRIHQVQWMTQVLEVLHQKADLGKLLLAVGPKNHTAIVLVNGKRSGAEDGTSGIVLNPSGTQGDVRLPFDDVKLNFESDPKKSFSVGGNTLAPSTFLGGF